MADLLIGALGLRDRAVKLLQLLLRRGDIGIIGSKEIAALDGSEIGGEIVEVAQNPCFGQPQIGNVLGDTIKTAQTRDTEQPKHNDQQKEKQEDNRQMESD